MKKNFIKQIIVISLLLVLSQMNLAEIQLDINVNPEDYVYIYEANGDRGYYNAMIHNVAFINRSEGIIILDHVTIDVVKNGKAIRRIVLTSEELLKNAQKGHMMESRGQLKLYDFFLKTKTFLGESVTLSPTLEMNSRTAIISISNYFSLKGIPDNFKIKAFFRKSKGELITASTSIKAVQYKQTNSFRFPLNGTWWVSAGAEISGHHRWVFIEEFGFDLVKIGESGLTYKNSGSLVEDYFCFDQDVVAAADGEVVKVQTGLSDDSSMLKQKNETREVYDQRIGLSQYNMLKNNFYHSAGNFIVIRHTKGEYSFYAHLKHKSIVVKKGDKVKMGQLIGKVGHSGNSTEPHLHFQISNGEDPFLSRAIPVKFSNINLFERIGDSFLRSGDIVRTIND